MNTLQLQILFISLHCCHKEFKINIFSYLATNITQLILKIILSSAYSVSKIGVTAMSMVQARELKNDQREGILVNAVSIDKTDRSLFLCLNCAKKFVCSLNPVIT